MARIFIDGFESGNLGLWSASSGATVVAAQAGMDDAYNAYVSAYGHYFARVITATSEVYVAFKVRVTGFAPTAGAFVTFYKGATCLGYFGTYADGHIYAHRGSGASAILAGARPLVTGVTYKMEVRFKPHDTTGVFQVKIDGLMVIDFTGDTTPSADTTVDEVRFGQGGAPYENNMYVDSVVIDDAAWPGDTKVAKVLPTAAGNAANWTPSAGSNYACVDEVPPSDSDYLTTNANGTMDTYQAGDLPADAATVRCVQFSGRAQKEGASTPQNLKFVVRHSGTDYPGAAVGLPTTLTEHIRELIVTNPGTSNPFTVSDVNGMEIGIESAA